MQTPTGLTSHFLRNSSASLTWPAKPRSLARPSLPALTEAPPIPLCPAFWISFLPHVRTCAPSARMLLPPLADSSLRFHLPCHGPKEVSTLGGVLHFPVYFHNDNFFIKMIPSSSNRSMWARESLWPFLSHSHFSASSSCSAFVSRCSRCARHHSRHRDTLSNK